MGYEQTSHLFAHNHSYQINKTTETNAENTLKVHGLKLSNCMVDTVTDWHSETLRRYYCYDKTRYIKLSLVDE